MARPAWIFAALPLALAPRAVVAQGAFDEPPAGSPGPGAAAPAPSPGSAPPAPAPDAGRSSVRIGEPAPAGASRPEALADAFAALHGFYQDQIEAARVVQMESNAAPVTDLATRILDDFKDLDLALARLSSGMGLATERGGPLGATEVARDFAHRERIIQLGSVQGRALDAAWLAPLPDDMRYGLGLVNAARLSGTLDPEVLRYLNGAGVEIQVVLDRAQRLIVPRLDVAAGRAGSAG